MTSGVLDSTPIVSSLTYCTSEEVALSGAGSELIMVEKHKHAHLEHVVDFRAHSTLSMLSII